MIKMKAFACFKFRGIKFIATPHDSGVGIISEDYGNFGAFYSIESFKKFYEKIPMEPICKSMLSFRIMPQNWEPNNYLE